MSVLRCLCISDIHGDAAALSAVLATAEQRGYDKLLVAGDLCFPGPAPLEVWRRLVQARAVCVQGVADRAIAVIDPSTIDGSNERERERIDELARVRRELGDVILRRLLELEERVRLPLPGGGELVLVHGSPLDPTEPITHDMSDDEVRALLGDDPADIVVCGGSHVPFDRTVMGVRVVNVGSVGEALTGGGPRHAEATFLEVRAGRELAAAGALPGAFVVEVAQILVPLEEEPHRAVSG